MHIVIMFTVICNYCIGDGNIPNRCAFHHRIPKPNTEDRGSKVNTVESEMCDARTHDPSC